MKKWEFGEKTSFFHKKEKFNTSSREPLLGGDYSLYMNNVRDPPWYTYQKKSEMKYELYISHPCPTLENLNEVYIYVPKTYEMK